MTRRRGRQRGAILEVPLLLPSILFLALVAWTLLILLSSSFRFNVDWPRARLPLETAGIVVAVLIAALAYIRFSLDGSRSFLFLALAFVVIGANRLVFGVVLQPSIVGLQEGAYLWTVARLMMGVLLLLGAVRWATAGAEARHPLTVFLIGSLGSLAVLSAVEAPLWLLRAHLPPLATGAVRVDEVRGILPGLTGIDLAMGLVGAAVFLIAALLYVRPSDRPFSMWLPSALVVAAFSHIHYMLMPTVFGDRISTGDLLRLAFSGVLLVGLIGEMWATFLAERERTRELQGAYEAERERIQDLEEAERTRAELLGMLTHELLHPVAATRSMVLVLQRRWQDLNDDAKVELVERLDVETRNLVALAERVPSVAHSTMEPFPLLFQDREVGQLLAEAGAAPPNGHAIELRVPPEVARRRIRVDPVRILQVFRNLLSNADKFSPSGSPIVIEAEAGGDEVRFRVIDRGPGVSPEEAERLFEPFARGTTAQQGGIPGSGLGLYVSRGIVEGHGGRIWVEPGDPGGSAFSFTIPTSASAGSEA
ncbi:MAG TPA: ATP-binding protein [Actinomycetota bacterium]